MDRFATSSKFLVIALLAFVLAEHAVATNLRIVSLNMNGRLDQVDNFTSLLNEEQVIVLQEVNDPRATRARYTDYPYVHYVTNHARRNQKNSIMLLSKVPFAEFGERLVQTDPQIDRWQRHAHWVKLKIDTNRQVTVFHYHNTWNFYDKNATSEREGLTKFISWVKETMGVTSLTATSNIVLAGDFNLRMDQGADVLLRGLNCQYNNVDYVCSTTLGVTSGTYNTRNGISDIHNAPWIELSSTINSPAVVGRRVRLFNTFQNEYMYAGSFAPFDNDRRRVFTWRRGGPVTQGTWLLEPDGNNAFRIFNTFHREYLYAADFAPFDEERRRIFTWRPGWPLTQGAWVLSGTGDSVFVYNRKQGEYLYAGDFAPYDSDRRRVFSWRRGNPVRQGLWRIEYV